MPQTTHLESIRGSLRFFRVLKEVNHVRLFLQKSLRPKFFWALPERLVHMERIKVEHDLLPKKVWYISKTMEVDNVRIRAEGMKAREKDGIDLPACFSECCILQVLCLG